MSIEDEIRNEVERLRPLIDKRYAIATVNESVQAEVERQDAKWGPQDHPLVHELVWPTSAAYEEIANDWKTINDQRVKDGQIDWAGILLEEVYEALAETDTEAACTELVQVMAVAAQMILNLRERAS